MSAVETSPQATEWTHELAPLRSRAEFALARPLRSRRRGRVGGLQGQMHQTGDRLRARIRADAGTITFADAASPADGAIDPDRWPWIELDVEAVRRSPTHRLVTSRGRLALNGARVTFDALIHDLGTAPAGGPWPERQLLAITAAVPRDRLVDALSPTRAGLRRHQLSRLELDLYLEFTRRETP